MIVCHCTGASDREIRRAARSTGNAGAAGTYCGGCCAEVTRLIDLEKSTRQTPVETSAKSGGRKQAKRRPNTPPAA